MKKTKYLPALAAAATLAFAAANSMAESRYNYAPSGTGTLSATAAVKINVTVPKLIVLRVGSTNNTQDTLTWNTLAPSIPGTPTTPVAGAALVDWTGAAPTMAAGTEPGALTVWAWTNASTANINCSVGAWSAANGPTNAAFKVAVTGTLAHPGADLGACAQTNFAQGSVVTGTWTYTLDMTNAATWHAGAYEATVTYTAQGI